MTDNIKELQQLAEAKGTVAPLEWSTISHTHGGGAKLAGASDGSVDAKGALNLIKQLQQLPKAGDAAPLDWSTISHTHGPK